MTNPLDKVERTEKNLRVYVYAEFCFKHFVVITRTTCCNILKMNFAHPHVTYLHFPKGKKSAISLHSISRFVCKTDMDFVLSTNKACHGSIGQSPVSENGSYRFNFRSVYVRIRWKMWQC